MSSIESGSQGLLLTRVADTNAVNLFSPPDGMIIYFTDGKATEPYGKNAGIFERKGNKWKRSGMVIDTAVDQTQSAIKFTYNEDTLVLHIPNASGSIRGVMSGGKQTFEGVKIFNKAIGNQVLSHGSVIFAKDTVLSGGAAITIFSQDNANFFWDNKNFRLGVGSNTPSAKLDVKGNFKLGGNGSVINSLIRDSVSTSSPIPIDTGEGHLYSFPLSNVKAGANVIISPQNLLPAGCIIAYAYSTTGNIHIRIENLKAATIPSNFKFYVTIIQ